MKKYVHVIFLMNRWEVDPRKHFIKEIIKATNSWSDVIIIQHSIGLLGHLFTRFNEKIIGLIKGKYKTKRLENGALLFTPIIIFHYGIWLKHKIISFIDIYLLKFQLDHIKSKYFRDQRIILWLYIPKLYPFANRIVHDYLVYDYQDNYDFNYDGTSSRLDTIYNRMLIKESNLVICSALTMYNIAKRINENSILSYNGNDYNTLTCHSNDISRTELSDLDKPIIGYLGGIRYWFDFELLEYLLENMKNTYIVFIGILYRNAKNNFYKLLKHKNVIWLNYVQHHQLNLYLKKFSIGIIPFKIDGFTAGVFPNKFFEYMAMGIPIVTTALPELKIYSSLIGYSNTKEEFLDYCKEALKGKFDILKDKYRDLAKHNTWEIRAISINKILFSTLMNV